MNRRQRDNVQSQLPRFIDFYGKQKGSSVQTHPSYQRRGTEKIVSQFQFVLWVELALVKSGNRLFIAPNFVKGTLFTQVVLHCTQSRCGDVRWPSGCIQRVRSRYVEGGQTDSQVLGFKVNLQSKSINWVDFVSEKGQSATSIPASTYVRFNIKKASASD